ncbi:MAG TPA: cytochrome c [Gammaproteobacteria bacterium]|nr:cytochrome c [Gammaproteobacteria bacterium]
MRIRAVLPTLLLCAVAHTAAADGDPQAGAVKVETCRGCHGIPDYTNVYPTYRVPKIAGQQAGYLVAALKAYQTGERRHPTMHAQASTLSEQDIRDIAAYLAGLGGK